jgi:hypothetical protein
MLVFASVPGYLYAQTDEVSTVSSSEVVSSSSSTSGEVGMTGWNLFWFGVRERVSLVTTFDPVKKAEKALKFAEERTKIAERLADITENPKAEERINTMLERAARLEQQADKVKDKLLENPDARAQLLLKNLINFKERKEEVFLKLEEKLAPEQLERLENLRSQAEEKSRSLMNALENANIPEEVREHLEQVKMRIEEHREQVELFRDEQKELLDRVKSGDDTAKEELETLREDRAAEIKLNVEERQERRIESNTSTTSSTIRLRREGVEKREEMPQKERLERRIENRLRPVLPEQIEN